MERLGPTLIVLALLLVILGLMLLGWRNRRRRQADVAPLPAIPGTLSEPLRSVEGQYVVTTAGGDWLDRIAVHGLGMKANATATLYPEGVLLERTGAPDVWIGVNALEDVGLTSGMAGKFVEKDGLVVISWRLGDRTVDTGFRTRYGSEKRPLLDAIASLMPGAAA